MRGMGIYRYAVERNEYNPSKIEGYQNEIGPFTPAIAMLRRLTVEQ